MKHPGKNPDDAVEEIEHIDEVRAVHRDAGRDATPARK